MKKNLFEMGAKFEDGWSSDNKSKPQALSKEIKEPTKHLLTFVNEKRRGKTVTIIKPFFLKTDALKSLLKELKKSLGSGGTIKENTLELQGEVSTKAKEFLTQKGFRFK
jgi:translation initiation factor 1